MNTMNSSSSNYTDLQEYLAKHSKKDAQGNNAKSGPPSHTRIGDKTLNVFGGSYFIEPEELPEFYRLYYEHVFVKGRKEYLTERQLSDNGPILLDFDFHYNYDVTTRLHTQEHIIDIIQLYLEELKKMLVFSEGQTFPIFVFEKPNVNRVVDKQITKDGIHIIIGIQMDHTLQLMLRDRIMNEIVDVIDLPLINSWDKVLDDTISSGNTNWQLYGSRKPGNEAYVLTYHVVAELDTNDNEWMTTARNVKEFDFANDFQLLSAQYSQHLKVEMNPDIKDEYDKKNELRASKAKKSSSGGTKGKINLVFPSDDTTTEIRIVDIKDEATLQQALDTLMDSLKAKEQYIRETHEYTQILPEKYYEPGSHLLNRKVAFALKHTDERLFLSWVKLRSKASDFDYSTIPKLYYEWTHHFHKRPDGVTRKSIMYWAKQDAPSEWDRVRNTTIDHYIEETIYEAGDWDYAMVLFHMYKDTYACSSIKNKEWYVYKNHRWIIDEGMSLRKRISKDLFELYSEKQNQYLVESQSYETSDEKHEKLQRKTKKIAEICLKLKKTNDKNNIMREAMEIFFDADFARNIDANPYLMGFTNGVFDFKNKVFRNGVPQDYISKSTNIPYTPYNYEATKEIADEILTFMDQLFPEKELCRYMWDHLSASLIGVKKEHVFNIYRGSGSNGKSLLTDLMSRALGAYKGVVPITLVTDKRSSLGSATPEIMQLKGVRYAVMQEPSSGVTINEGIVKELTGGDPLLGRALFSNSEIFIPQFSLVVCTNALFDVKSNDDGTWRRMKLVDYKSKFVSEGETYTDTTPYIFPKDKNLKDKLDKWASVFIAMLIERACETEGEVVDCPEVLSASNRYRQSQDCITGFITEKIVLKPGNLVSKKYLNDVFKEWFQMNFSGRKPPKLADIEEIMNKKFNKDSKTNKWIGIAIREDDNPTEEAIEELANN